MNYRHAFHAGNHADVLKHSVIARILAYMLGKEKPLRALDVHAGIGIYDLAGPEAGRTLEWRDGIGRLWGDDGERLPLAPPAEALLAPWRNVVEAVNGKGPLRRYPGSPELFRRLLRPRDRLNLNELHPEDHARLLAWRGRDRRIAVTRLDAAVAVKAQLPPPERRGIVLIDPPYEREDEVERAVRMLADGLKRFATGVFVLWYPETGDGLPERLRVGAAALSLPPTLDLGLEVARPRPGGGLQGSGLLVLNPPFTLAGEMDVLLPALAERLRQGEGARHRLAWLSRGA
jgi:23S rRNA (adenine2030-N6)-methyltransferase